MIGMPGGTELFVILLIVLILFGGKKLPELMEGLGKGIKNFKKGIKNTDPKDIDILNIDKKPDNNSGDEKS